MVQIRSSGQVHARDEADLQSSVLRIFLRQRAVLFLEDVAARELAGGLRAAVCQYDAEFRATVAGRRIVWLHAVSVGEVNVCTQLIRALEPRLPGVTLLVSTTTSTGMGELRKQLPEHVLKMYYPIDRRGGVRRALDVIRPTWLTPGPVMRPSDWPGFVDQPMTVGELASLRESVHRGTPFGSAQWRQASAKQHGLESTLRPRGRPRKAAPTPPSVIGEE